MLLVAPPVITYEPAPWYVHWLEVMPISVIVVLAILAAFAWLLKKPIEEFAGKLFDMLTERLKRSSKQPVSSEELARKAMKAVRLEQKAESLRLKIGCDHVSVYGCQNGEYLRSGEGIDKFVMQAEAVEEGLARYMDTERIVFAQDIPRTVNVLSLEPPQPYLLLWAERCDDWKVNKMMKERGYTSSIAVFVRRPLKPGDTARGVIGMYVLSWRDCEIYREDQASTLPKAHHGPTRLLDEHMEHLLQDYANEFSYSM
jgi:hypothetical protein